MIDFKLRIGEFGGDTGVLRWGLSEEWLSTHNPGEYWVCWATFPIIAGGGLLEVRGYTKVLDGFDIVKFSRSGGCGVLAFLTSNKSTVRNFVEVGGFIYHPWEGDNLDTFDYSVQDNYRGYLWNIINVEVPSDGFIVNPSASSEAWVNFFWGNTTRNRYKYNFRKILSLLQVPIFAFIVGFRIIIYCIIFIHGFRGLRAGPIYLPHLYGTLDILPDIPVQNRYVPEKYQDRGFGWLVVLIIFGLFMGGFCLLLHWDFSLGVNFLVLYFLGFGFGVPLLLFTILYINVIQERVLLVIKKVLDKLHLWGNNRKDTSHLILDSGGFIKEVEKLPPGWRGFKLKIRARICKIFWK